MLSFWHILEPLRAGVAVAEVESLVFECVVRGGDETAYCRLDGGRVICRVSHICQIQFLVVRERLQLALAVPSASGVGPTAKRGLFLAFQSGSHSLP